MADTGARKPTASSGFTYLSSQMYDGNENTKGGLIHTGTGALTDCTLSAIEGSDLPEGSIVQGVKWDFINSYSVIIFSYESVSLTNIKLSLNGGSSYSSAIGSQIDLGTSINSDYSIGGETEDWGLDWSGFTDMSDLVLKVDIAATDGEGWKFPLFGEINVTVYYVVPVLATNPGSINLKSGNITLKSGKINLI